MYDKKISGGGSCNSCVNDKGKIMGGKGSPKDTSGGADLGPHATNTIGPKHSNKMLSPGPGVRSHGK